MNTLDTAKKERCCSNAINSLSDGIEELQKAIEKHPLFADKLMELTKAEADQALNTYRRLNDNGRATGATIFLEEWCEFLEAVQNNDKSAARHELAQCIAMLLRIGIHIDDYMAKDKQD